MRQETISSWTKYRLEGYQELFDLRGALKRKEWYSEHLEQMKNNRCERGCYEKSFLLFPRISPAIYIIHQFTMNLADGIDTDPFAAGASVVCQKYDLTINGIHFLHTTSIPGYTPSYIYKTRDEVLFDLRQKIRELSSFFVKNEKYRSTEEDSKKLIVECKLSRYFLEHGMDRAFVGKAKHAKSYLTSEYLYRYFKDNPMFDYTPIVSGYIKSIELLLHAICVNYRNAHHIHRDMHEYTMGSYTVFLDMDSNGGQLKKDADKFLARLFNRRKEMLNASISNAEDPD